MLPHGGKITSAQKEWAAGSAGTATQLLSVWRGQSVSLRDGQGYPHAGGTACPVGVAGPVRSQSRGFPRVSRGFPALDNGRCPCIARSCHCGQNMT